MYQALLIRRYLSSKIMPLLASLAVVLCTAMVLIVWSVMGGFLNKLVSSGRTLIGDVMIVWPTTGFAHYQDLIQRLEADPQIQAATPVIETYGMLGLPNGLTQTVIVKGVDGPSFSRVTEFDKTLWWRAITEPARKDKDREDPRFKNQGIYTKIFENGRTLSRPEVVRDADQGDLGERKPAVVLGIEVSEQNIRSAKGFFYATTPRRRNASGGYEDVGGFLSQSGYVTLSVPPSDSKGMPTDMVSKRLPVANEFYSGIYDIDRRTVMVDLPTVQRMLKMDAGKRAKSAGAAFKLEKDPATGRERFVPSFEEADEPARVTTVLVRGKGEVSTGDGAKALAEKCRVIYHEFAKRHAGRVPDSLDIGVRTWEDQNRTLISAVKKETALVLFIFSFISMTAVFLVLAIFWSMVSEKTKDVGVLRSIGASRTGVAGVWLGYGMVIGVVGALLGLWLAYTIVTNINPIHEWLGETFKLYIWDPKVYYFTELPNKVDPQKAKWVLVGGMLSSVLGSLIPALRAAWMDPVKALRFE